MDESASFAAVDIVSAVAKALTLMAVLQATGIAMFATLYRRQLGASINAIQTLGQKMAVAAAVLALVHQALGAARMAGDFDGMWDATLSSLNWYSASAASAAIRALGMVAILVALKRESKVWSLIGVAAVIVSFNLTGHSTTHEPRIILGAALSVHVAVAAFWFGALPALLIVLKRESSTHAVAAFSAHAIIVVPGLAVAGFAMAYCMLPNIAALATPYGLAIVVKANSFMVLMGLAALNKWRFVPALQRGDRQAVAPFCRAMQAEYVLIVIVLCATALLTTLFSPE